MEITDLEQLGNFISARPAVMIYFYNDNCAPCIALSPKVSQLIESDFPKMALAFVNAAVNELAAARFGIFSAPTLLVFFEGKESIRESKYISINELQEKISRYYELLFD